MSWEYKMEENLSKGEIVIYTSNDGHVSLDARLEKETIWLTQVQIADLFSVKRPAISKHIKNIFESGELIAESNPAEVETMKQIVVSVLNKGTCNG